MSVLFKKEVKAVIDYLEHGTNTQRTGEGIWEFALDDESGAFAYGNHTYARCNIKEIVNGEEFKDEKVYDTRYYKGITSEKTFEQFCLDAVKEYYGSNAKEVFFKV